MVAVGTRISPRHRVAGGSRPPPDLPGTEAVTNGSAERAPDQQPKHGFSPSRNPSTSRKEIDGYRWPSTIVRARDARAKRNQAGVAIRHKQSDSKKTNGGSS
jgi:hypothetical protein